MDEHCSAAPHLLNIDHHNSLKLSFCCCCESSHTVAIPSTFGLCDRGLEKDYSRPGTVQSFACDESPESRDPRHETRATSHEPPDTRYQTPDTRHQTPDTRHQTSDTRYQTPDIRYQIPDAACHNYRRAFEGDQPQLPLIRTASYLDGDPTVGTTSKWTSTILSRADDVAKAGHGSRL